MEREFFVIGAKWFDKVNGNTYCNAKVYDAFSNTYFYIGFQYGYGDQYFEEALKEIRKRYPNKEIKGAVNAGCFYIKYRDLKNNNF